MAETITSNENQVMRSPIAGVGGIFNARSCARFRAVPAQCGELDAVRLLSAEHVADCNKPRTNPGEPEIRRPLPIQRRVLPFPSAITA